MSDTLAGSGSYIYWGRTATYKGGNRAVDRHQAFNPMLKSPDFPESMKYIIEKKTTFNKLEPNIEFDKELGEGTVRFRCYFRDPMIISTIFTYKGVTGTWSGTGDQLTFNFSNNADIDNNLWVSYHLHDQSGASNHMDIFLDGGQIISYKWILEQGEPVVDEFEIKFDEISVGTLTTSQAYAVDIDAGFDDGSFDQTGVAEVSTITTIAASGITTGDYFKIWLANGTGGWTAYYVWFNKAAGDGDPAPTGYTEVEIAIASDATAATIATAIGAALDAAHANFGTPVVSDTLVTVTQLQTGDIPDVVDVNVGFTFATTTQGATALDGGWSNWDGAYGTTEAPMVVDSTVTFNGASITDLGISTIELDVKVPKATRRTQESLTVAGFYNEARPPFEANISGTLLKGNNLLAQPSTALASKTQGTFKIQYGTTKYLQFTLGRVEDGSASGVEAGKPSDGSVNVISGANSVLTYSWNATETTDPSNHINHTDL